MSIQATSDTMQHLLKQAKKVNKMQRLIDDFQLKIKEDAQTHNVLPSTTAYQQLLNLNSNWGNVALTLKALHQLEHEPPQSQELERARARLASYLRECCVNLAILACLYRERLEIGRFNFDVDVDDEVSAITGVAVYLAELTFIAQNTPTNTRPASLSKFKNWCIRKAFTSLLTRFEELAFIHNLSLKTILDGIVKDDKNNAEMGIWITRS